MSRAPAPPLSDAEQAAATVRRQMQAVARGDGETACGLLLPEGAARGRGRDQPAGREHRLRDGGRAGGGRAPDPVRAALRRPAITRVELRKDRATVDIRLPAGLTTRDSARLPLRRTGDGWRVDGLPPL